MILRVINSQDKQLQVVGVKELCEYQYRFMAYIYVMNSEQMLDDRQ